MVLTLDAALPSCYPAAPLTKLSVHNRLLVAILLRTHVFAQVPLIFLLLPLRCLQAYVLPDIVFLPTAAIVYALNEPVPASKPRLVVSAAAVAQARGPPQQHAPQQRHGHPASRTPQRRGRDDASIATSPTATAAAAARLSMTPVRWGGGTLGPQEGAGSPPALRQQQCSLQPGPQLLMGPPGTPQVPLALAQAAAQVQAMLQQQLAIQQHQQQLAHGMQGPVLLPVLQPMPLGLLLATPTQQSLAAKQQQQQQPEQPEQQQFEQQQSEQQQSAVQQAPPPASQSPSLQAHEQEQHQDAPSAGSPASS